MKFTDRSIKALKSKDKRYEVPKDSGNGLGLRITPNGQKSFIFRYKFQNRQRGMLLGSYPETTLSEVGLKHAQARSLIKQGIDPSEKALLKKTSELEAETVDQLVDIYIKGYAKKYKKSWQTDERILKKDIVPTIGKRKVKDVTRKQLKLLFDAVADRAPVQANRLHAVTRRMFNYAIEEELIDANPCYLIKSPGGKEKPVERKLEEAEIRLLWRRLHKLKVSPLVKLAIKFLLVSAQRPGEVLGMRWGDISGDWWTMPETKNNLSHRVPITPLAMKLLEHAQRYSMDDRVFPFSDTAVNQAIKRNIKKLGIDKFTPHDLRRTAGTRMASAGVSRLVLAKLLNHKDKGVTSIYDRHSYDPEKRQALEAWSKQIMVMLGYGKKNNVIDLKVGKNV
ncbi:MAG: tyrosine-type recombinase/integrase [Pseudohongiella sp.]